MSYEIMAAVAAALRVHSEGSGCHAGMRARVHGMATQQHTLTRRCSIAALGLGLGIKGCQRCISSAIFIVAIIISETVEAIAVGGSQFVQARQLQLLVRAAE
jgi:hypothetical protein